MNAYKSKDLKQFETVINEAKLLWIELAKKEFELKGDNGCCVLGAGLQVEVLYPRCKYPRDLTIISFNEVSPCQGEHAVSVTAKKIVEFLKEKGLETKYNYGRMD